MSEAMLYISILISRKDRLQINQCWKQKAMIFTTCDRRDFVFPAGRTSNELISERKGHHSLCAPLSCFRFGGCGISTLERPVVYYNNV
jgi:hypothetical protein